MKAVRALSVSLSAVVIAGLAVAACEQATTTAPMIDHRAHAALAAPTDGSGSFAAASSTAGLFKEVHSVAARYNFKTQAAKNGYNEDTFCVAHPTLGGMGYHWVNGGLVDPVFDPLEPEVMLYSPDANGQSTLAAVEYIVINVGQPRPSFNGHLFDIGGTPVPVAHWSLHVWLYRDNPSGIFSPWNPAVHCP